jgi:pimeloyl-ACP methyl ester carboxylesterase
MFPASLPGYSTRFVRVAHGLSVRVIEAHAAPPHPSSSTALLIHGWGCSCFVWRRNLPVLAAEGVRALAIDLPGHGLSDKPSGAEHYTADAMADVVLATLDALQLDRVALVAHSLGAVIARRAAERAPDRVSSLVLLAPVSIGRVPLVRLAKAISPHWIEPMIPHVAFRWTIAIGLWLSRGGKRSLSQREVDEYWAPTQFPEMTMAAVHMLHALDWKPQSSAIPTRTLVILAGGDRLVRAAPDATYRVIPGAGHNVQEQAPDEVNSLVLRFLTP